MKINQWIFYSLFLGLISCQSQEQTFTLHCSGLDAYEGDTVRYQEYLGKINQKLGQMADEVVEVVYGIPIWLKGGKSCENAVE